MHEPELPFGGDESAARAAAQRESLVPGTQLGDFEIVRTLGNGGFGTVYLARDRLLERDVAVKEYLPAQLAYRAEGLQVAVRSPAYAASFSAGLRSFVNEAKILARFNHPAVVKVHCFWEANGTAYMVMPWVRGPTLREVRRAMKAPPTEAWLRGLLDPLLDALAMLHAQGIYHRDIAPDNILLPSPVEPVLLDFGAARRVIGDRTQTITAVLKPSFAPIEQYAEASQLRQGPWTDLYALGAVVVFLLTAVPPPPSTVRSMQDDLPLLSGQLPGVSENFLAAIQWALAVRPQDRPQSVQEFCNALNGLIAPPALAYRAPQPALPPIQAVAWQVTTPQALALEAAPAPADALPADDPIAQAAAAAFAPPPSVAWDPTIRLVGPPQLPRLPIPLVKPPRRLSRRAWAATATALAVAGMAVVAAMNHRVREPEVATWRALGRQAIEIEVVDPKVIEEEIPSAPRTARAAAEPLVRAEPPPPVLRTVAATVSTEPDARVAERRPPAAARGGAGSAKGADRRGPSRKGGASARTKGGSTTSPQFGPREACGERSFFGMAICLNRQCESPRFEHHPYCVDLQRRWLERRMRGEHP
ncbi:MAG: serine/threonine protein kinase [Rhizobacter sp.]